MTARHRLGTVAAGVAAAMTFFLPTPAHGADEVNVDHVEVAEDGVISVLLGLPGGAEADLDDIQVTIDGETVADVEAQAVEAGEIQRTTVLALDASNSMQGDSFAQAQAAAKAFIDSAPPDVSIGLLTFSGTIQDTITPTTDHTALADAINDIELTAGTHVYEAVAEAAALAGTEGARSVLVLSDGQDEGGGTTLDQAVTAAQDAEVVVDVVALEQSRENRELLAQISDASGGQVIEAATPEALTAVFTAQADALADQVLLQFPQPDGVAGEASIDVTVPAESGSLSDSAFVTLAAPTDSGPKAVERSEPLVGTTAFVLGSAAVGLALALLLATALGGTRGPSDAERKLAAYFGTQGDPGQAKGRRRNKGTDQPSLRETAVAATQTIVKGDFEARLTMRLAGAGSALTAAEWLLLHAGIAMSATFLGFVLRGGAAAFLGLVLGVVGPWFWLRRKHSKRLALFNTQLAETLTLMAGGLSAGLSMPQAIDTVVREGNEPMSSELRRALMEARLGVEIEDALDALAERMKSEDFAWVVMAIRIQREVGGNLAELLTTVSETLRERDYLRRQVKVLSAEGRMSAYVLGGLPIVMFFYMLLVRPDAIRPLYTEPIGFVMSGVAITMLLMGFWVLSRIVKIEV